MTNKNMVLSIYLIMDFLLYDLYFNIAWPLSPLVSEQHNYATRSASLEHL